jgi:hypothetical protein
MSIRYDERRGLMIVRRGTRRGLHGTGDTNTKGVKLKKDFEKQSQTQRCLSLFRRCNFTSCDGILKVRIICHRKLRERRLKEVIRALKALLEENRVDCR